MIPTIIYFPTLVQFRFSPIWIGIDRPQWPSKILIGSFLFLLKQLNANSSLMAIFGHIWISFRFWQMKDGTVTMSLMFQPCQKYHSEVETFNYSKLHQRCWPIMIDLGSFGVNFKRDFSLKNNQSRRNLLTYQNECELNEDSLSLVTSTNWNRSIDLTFDRTKPGLRFGQIGKSHRLEFKFKNSKRLFTIGSLSTLSSNQWNENHILYPSE